MPNPKNRKDLLSALGLFNYYRRFCANYAVVAKPLFVLTGHETEWTWSSREQEAFDHLKKKLCDATALAVPDLEKEFILITDGSGDGIGAVLAQDMGTQGKPFERPVAFYSRQLREFEKKWHISEVEALAVIAALKKFRPYLEWKRKVKLICDNQALVGALNNRSGGSFVARQARWALEIQKYDVTVMYRKSKQNVADWLSRAPLPLDAELAADGKPEYIASFRVLEAIQMVTRSRSDIARSQQADREVTQIRKALDGYAADPAVQKMSANCEIVNDLLGTQGRAWDIGPGLRRRLVGGTPPSGPNRR
jgi:hypothetical protein